MSLHVLTHLQYKIRCATLFSKTPQIFFEQLNTVSCPKVTLKLKKWYHSYEQHLNSSLKVTDI